MNVSHWLTEGVEKAGMILSIIAAGGMFGEVLQATGMGKNLGELLSGLSLGIFFPFLITAVLKTAQGSTTVAIITASSLVVAMLAILGLHISNRRYAGYLEHGRRQHGGEPCQRCLFLGHQPVLQPANGCYFTSV